MAAAQLGLDSMPPAGKALSLQAFFANYNAIWQSRHRNGDAGYVSCEQLSDDHLVVTVVSPYPDDIFYGAFYTYARFFRPKDKSFTVSYDKYIPTQDQGGEKTVIHIQLD